MDSVLHSAEGMEDQALMLGFSGQCRWYHGREMSGSLLVLMTGTFLRSQDENGERMQNRGSHRFQGGNPIRPAGATGSVGVTSAIYPIKRAMLPLSPKGSPLTALSAEM
ncbi:hypothetical protein EYF80_005649 [Liparis tanakae]|uniref:Uncharacterized protein n=1 Tax=Liparis tanakae TaxID=230148 RepID=A0A4Z2J3H4_9TELE|nr:hypothetical protein EYF80_005649 [Liparis tanakae]